MGVDNKFADEEAQRQTARKFGSPMGLAHGGKNHLPHRSVGASYSRAFYLFQPPSFLSPSTVLPSSTSSSSYHILRVFFLSFLHGLSLSLSLSLSLLPSFFPQRCYFPPSLSNAFVRSSFVFRPVAATFATIASIIVTTTMTVIATAPTPLSYTYVYTHM